MEHAVGRQQRQSLTCSQIDQLPVDAIFVAAQVALDFNKNIS